MENKQVVNRSDIGKKPASAHNYRRSLFKSTLMRNFLVAVTGTAGAQAITMICSPIIAHLYSPEAFGILGTFLAVVSVLEPFAALCYPVAVVIPRGDEEALKIIYLCVFIAIGVAGVIFLLLLIFRGWFVSILNLQNIQPYLFLIPPILLAETSVQLVQQWLIRKKQFKINSKISIINSVFVNAAKILYGLFRPVAGALISITVIGSVFQCFNLIMTSRNKGQKKHNVAPSFQELKMVARKYYDFPLFRTPQAFLNSISSNLPTIMLISCFGPIQAGFYTLCKRLLSMPTQWVGKSVGDVFYTRVNEAVYNKENVRVLLVKTTLSLALVGFIPFSIVIGFGPNLFTMLFGIEWTPAGEYARWLALWLYFAFINRPSIVAIPSLGLQSFFLFFELFSTLLRGGSMFVGYYYYRSDMMAIKLFSFSGIVSNVILIGTILVLSKAASRLKT